MSNKNGIFTEKTHTYEKSGIKYRSVTGVIGKYKYPFDREHWSTFKALLNMMGNKWFFSSLGKMDLAKPESLAHIKQLVDQEQFKLAQKDVLDLWTREKDKSIKKGNRYHKRKEKDSLTRGYEVNPFTGSKVETKLSFDETAGIKQLLFSDLSELEDGYYPELVMFDKEHNLAGTADKVFLSTENGKRCVTIDDYKTNKKIYTSSRYGNYMLDPVAHLEDCNYNHYRLQISMYAYIMEKHGFTVKDLCFHHYNKSYKFDYLKPEILKILEADGKSR